MSREDHTISDDARGCALETRPRALPIGTAILLLLHAAVFVGRRVLANGDGAATEVAFVLHGSVSHPAAIVLHAVGAGSYIVLAATLLGIWLLGRRVERRFGTARLLISYVLATLASGAVYFGFAQAASELSIYLLCVPVGALAAWVVAARRGLRDEFAPLVARRYSVAQVAVLGAAVVAGLVFFFQGERATAWLLAAAAGGLTWPVVERLRGTPVCLYP